MWRRLPDLEVHVFQIGGGNSLRHIEDLETYHLAALVKIDDESRPQFLRLHDAGVTQPHVERVRLFIKANSHSFPLKVRSKYGVTTLGGSVL